MGKRSNLYEIYFGPISRKGRGYGVTGNDSKVSLGSEYTLGGNYGIYDEPDAIQIDEDEIDEIDDALVAKVDGNRPMIDPGSKANRQSNYTGVYTNLAEKKHTTTAVQGISPRMTYRNSKGGRATKTSFSSATYPRVYQSPRRDMTATQYGTARAPLPYRDESVYNQIFSLDDLIDGHMLSLHKHTNNINKIRSAINEINDILYDI